MRYHCDSGLIIGSMHQWINAQPVAHFPENIFSIDHVRLVGKCGYVAVNRCQEFGEICRSGAKYFLKSVVGGAAPPPPRCRDSLHSKSR